jgi:hypothetical protein
MDHEGRMRIANEIARRVGARFGDTILFGTLSGSVARNEDAEHSDLEVVFLTTREIRLPGMSPDGYREFVYRGLPTQIEFRTKEEALGLLTHVGSYWPVQVWKFLEPRVICGVASTTDRIVGEFRSRVEGLPEETFRKAAGHALLWIRMHLGKVKNAFAEGDDARTAQAAEWLGYEVACFVALVNRRYYLRSDLRWMRESESFPKLPDDYRDLMMRMHLARDREDVQRTVSDLCAACEALAAREGIRVETVEGLDEVGL